MDPSFWRERWLTRNTGWHQSQVNPLLAAHLDRLELSPGSRVFVPLCGKTLDIHWLLSRGLRVAGVELSQMAIRELFEELGVKPHEAPAGPLTHVSAEGLDIFVGDIFALTAGTLGPVDAVYDRAAIVALPREMRDRYTAHLAAVTQHAPQLLITFEYDQAAMDGPPFSVQPDEVRQHYAAAFTIARLDSRPVPGGLRGAVPALEVLWRLTPQG